MTDITERVARAIDPDLWTLREDGTTIGSDISIEQSLARARAAIKAMPTHPSDRAILEKELNYLLRRPDFWYNEDVQWRVREINDKLCGTSDPEREANAKHEDQWQPIETAPKDGRFILAFYSRGNWGGGSGLHCCVVVKWYDPCDNNPDLDPEVNPAKWNVFGPGSHTDNDLSHWMPLTTPGD